MYLRKRRLLPFWRILLCDGVVFDVWILLIFGIGRECNVNDEERGMRQ